MMYIFDPTQFSEFGHQYFEGDGFSYRYQFSKKIFWQSIYIPFGPNCDSSSGFDNFIKHIKSKRLTRVKIDLPMIYNPKQSLWVTKKLKENGFKKTNYVQDDETIIVINDDLLKMQGSDMKRVRYGLKRADVVIKNSITNKEIDSIYEVYLVAMARLGVKPKDKTVFEKLSENCLVSLAYGKDSKKLDGFLLGYLINTDLSSIVGGSAENLLLLILTGLTDKGREAKLGHAMHYELFKSAFEKYDVDVVDFHGASRKKGRSYVDFKTIFSKRFISLSGSFTRTRIF